jgi:hypothetical protein
VKENLIAPELTPSQIALTYANEADVLNVALFGITARQWRDDNPEKTGNIRDHATVDRLLVLANLESYNAILLEQRIPQEERLALLNHQARRQLLSIHALGTRMLEPLKSIGPSE